MPAVITALISSIIGLYLKYRLIKFVYSLFIIEVLFFAYKTITENIVNGLIDKIGLLGIDNMFGYIVWQSGFFSAFFTYLGLIATYSSYKFLFRLLSKLV